MIKPVRVLNSSNVALKDVDDATYEELSAGNQTIVITAEALGLKPQVATFTNKATGEARYDVHRSTCEAIVEALAAAAAK